jgi:hypothetical protein
MREKSSNQRLAQVTRVETIPFLRMAAIELRRIADAAPEVAAQLQAVADKLGLEADDLAQCIRE